MLGASLHLGIVIINEVCAFDIFAGWNVFFARVIIALLPCLLILGSGLRFS